MKNKYIYKGGDYSCGYRCNKIYDLDVCELGTGVIIKPSSENNTHVETCYYSSIEAFNRNWITITINKSKRLFSKIDPYGEENWDE